MSKKRRLQQEAHDALCLDVISLAQRLTALENKYALDTKAINDSLTYLDKMREHILRRLEDLEQGPATQAQVKVLNNRIDNLKDWIKSVSEKAGADRG